ncbi:XdhC family protein [Bacillus sp. Marseille-P3661]|uniref:XdhC family protein n=1 Tax=Bacillus sp. Marseille-P3661 TaxID=1936234 RepID=UPI000C818983|nr:XdhC family protein [Bacillus sp. Marseille-P3661]
MRSILNYLNIINSNPTNRYALATIIHIKGSAYRHEGAKMLFSENGERFGTISAGCLEEDLSHHALEVIQSQGSKVLTYDLSSEDDLTWGQSAGCNGAVTIYLECVQSNFNLYLVEMEEQLKNGDSLLLIKVLDEHFNIVMGLNITTGKYYGNAVDDHLKKYLHEFNGIQQGDVMLCKDRLYGEVIIEKIEPKENLYIFGAGPDVEPIVNVASKLDFVINIIDPRSDYCNKSNFPKANSLIIDHPDSYLKHNKVPENSYVLIMTHNFNWDRNILRHFINDPPYYLGILGPKKRTQRLLANENVPTWISSPVGLEINAEGAEEIGISIAAELIQMKNAKVSVKSSKGKLLV